MELTNDIKLQQNLPMQSVQNLPLLTKDIVQNEASMIKEVIAGGMQARIAAVEGEISMLKAATERIPADQEASSMILTALAQPKNDESNTITQLSTIHKTHIPTMQMDKILDETDKENTLKDFEQESLKY